MCAVSVIISYMEDRVPPEKWALFEKILDDIKQLDKILGQPDCIDPQKEEYLQAIRNILNKRQ